MNVNNEKWVKVEAGKTITNNSPFLCYILTGETEPSGITGIGLALAKDESFSTGSNSVWVIGGGYNHSELVITDERL